MAVEMRALLVLVGLLGWCVAAAAEEEEACLLQQTQRAPLSAAAGAVKAEETGKDTSHSWYVLGITNYTMENHHKADSYAWVTLHPGDLHYKSRITKHSKDGTADLHIFVPTSAKSAKIDIYLSRTLADTLVGDFVIDLTPSPAWCDLALAASSGCDFSGDLQTYKLDWTKLDWATKKVGTVSGYLATGAYMEKHVEDLHMRGVVPKYMDYSGVKTKLEQHRIRTDNIQNDMAYARAGSVFPESLHGIWYMDQRGLHLPQASDPEYKQVCKFAEDEILMSWGMAEWDPETRCAKGVTLKTSSPLKGQWAFLDQTGNGSESHAFYSGISGTLDMCFAEGRDDEMDLWLYVSLNSLADSIIGISPFQWGAFTTAPKQLLSYKMIKKKWGWDRASRSAIHDISDFILKAFGGIMGDAGFEPGDSSCHYPVFQVIDGNGNPTEHYEAYLAFANKQTDCKRTSFKCARNKGNGTIMVPRMVA